MKKGNNCRKTGIITYMICICMVLSTLSIINYPTEKVYAAEYDLRDFPIDLTDPNGVSIYEDLWVSFYPRAIIEKTHFVLQEKNGKIVIDDTWEKKDGKLMYSYTVPKNTLIQNTDYVITITLSNSLYTDTQSVEFKTKAGENPSLIYVSHFIPNEACDMGEAIEFHGTVTGAGGVIEQIYATYTENANTINTGMIFKVLPNSKEYSLESLPEKVVGSDIILPSGMYTFELYANTVGNTVILIDTIQFEINSAPVYTPPSSVKITAPLNNSIHSADNMIRLIWDKAVYDTTWNKKPDYYLSLFNETKSKSVISNLNAEDARFYDITPDKLEKGCTYKITLEARNSAGSAFDYITVKTAEELYTSEPTFNGTVVDDTIYMGESLRLKGSVLGNGPLIESISVYSQYEKSSTKILLGTIFPNRQTKVIADINKEIIGDTIFPQLGKYTISVYAKNVSGTEKLIIEKDTIVEMGWVPTEFEITNLSEKIDLDFGKDCLVKWTKSLNTDFYLVQVDFESETETYSIKLDSNETEYCIPASAFPKEGRYRLRVNALRNEGGIWLEEVNISVEDNTEHPVGKFSILSPSEGTYFDCSSDLGISWEEAEYVKYYQIGARNKTTKNDVFIDRCGSSTSYSIAKSIFSKGNTYEITVTAFGYDGSKRSKKITVTTVKGELSITVTGLSSEFTANRGDNVKLNGMISAGSELLHVNVDIKQGNTPFLNYHYSPQTFDYSLNKVVINTNTLKKGTYDIVISGTTQSKSSDKAGKAILIIKDDTEKKKTEEKNIPLLAGDKKRLSIIFSDGDSMKSVTKKLSLTTKGSNGSKISWKSSNKDIISNKGVVKRPTKKNTKVTLTATLKLGNLTERKVFKVTVKKLNAKKDDKETEDSKKPGEFTITSHKKKTVLNEPKDLSVKWTQSENATYYRYAVQDAAGKDIKKSTNIGLKNSITIPKETFTEGKTYTIFVTAYNDKEERYGQSITIEIPLKTEYLIIKKIENKNAITIECKNIEKIKKKIASVYVIHYEKPGKTDVAFEGDNNGDLYYYELPESKPAKTYGVGVSYLDKNGKTLAYGDAAITYPIAISDLYIGDTMIGNPTSINGMITAAAGIKSVDATVEDAKGNIVIDKFTVEVNGAKEYKLLSSVVDNKLTFDKLATGKKTVTITAHDVNGVSVTKKCSFKIIEEVIPTVIAKDIYEITKGDEVSLDGTVMAYSVIEKVQLHDKKQIINTWEPKSKTFDLSSVKLPTSGLGEGEYTFNILVKTKYRENEIVGTYRVIVKKNSKKKENALENVVYDAKQLCDETIYSDVFNVSSNYFTFVNGYMNKDNTYKTNHEWANVFDDIFEKMWQFVTFNGLSTSPYENLEDVISNMFEQGDFMYAGNAYSVNKVKSVTDIASTCTDITSGIIDIASMTSSELDTILKNSNMPSYLSALSDAIELFKEVADVKRAKILGIYINEVYDNEIKALQIIRNNTNDKKIREAIDNVIEKYDADTKTECIKNVLTKIAEQGFKGFVKSITGIIGSAANTGAFISEVLFGTSTLISNKNDLAATVILRREIAKQLEGDINKYTTVGYAKSSEELKNEIVLLYKMLLQIDIAGSNQYRLCCAEFICKQENVYNVTKKAITKSWFIDSVTKTPIIAYYDYLKEINGLLVDRDIIIHNPELLEKFIHQPLATNTSRVLIANNNLIRLINSYLDIIDIYIEE